MCLSAPSATIVVPKCYSQGGLLASWNGWGGVNVHITVIMYKICPNICPASTTFFCECSDCSVWLVEHDRTDMLRETAGGEGTVRAGGFPSISFKSPCQTCNLTSHRFALK